MNAVWIVDDDRSIRWVLEKALAREEIPYKSFGSAGEVLAALEGTPQPPGAGVGHPHARRVGLSLLSKVKARFPHMPVIIMTAYSDLDSAVAAFQGGAFEYLPKPFDVDQAVELVRRAIEESAHQVGPRKCSARCPRSSARRRPCRRSSAPSAACPSPTPRC
jgi:two-component system nitrogen regulation response regulator GlnG